LTPKSYGFSRNPKPTTWVQFKWDFFTLGLIIFPTFITLEAMGLTNLPHQSFNIYVDLQNCVLRMIDSLTKKKQISINVIKLD